MARIATCLALICVAAPAWSAFNGAAFVQIPTLDEVGLSALIALVVGVAGWTLRRRNRR